MRKPVIPLQARERILGFVNAVESLQLAYGISIHAEDDTVCLLDDKRTDRWEMSDGTSYGQWDAQFFGTDMRHPSFDAADLEFEDFEGWDK